MYECSEDERIMFDFGNLVCSFLYSVVNSEYRNEEKRVLCIKTSQDTKFLEQMWL